MELPQVFPRLVYKTAKLSRLLRPAATSSSLRLPCTSAVTCAAALSTPRRKRTVLRTPRQSRRPSPSGPNPRKKVTVRRESDSPAAARTTAAAASAAAAYARVDRSDPGAEVDTRVPIPAPPLLLHACSVIIRCCYCRCFVLRVGEEEATVVFLLVVVGVAGPVGKMERREGGGGDAAGDQEHRVEPPLVEAEPVRFGSVRFGRVLRETETETEAERERRKKKRKPENMKTAQQWCGAVRWCVFLFCFLRKHRRTEEIEEKRTDRQILQK